MSIHNALDVKTAKETFIILEIGENVQFHSRKKPEKKQTKIAFSNII